MTTFTHNTVVLTPERRAKVAAPYEYGFLGAKPENLAMGAVLTESDRKPS